MPIYTYKCECNNEFEKMFLTFSLAEGHENGFNCEKCGKEAMRVQAGKAPMFFMKFGDAPMYSSNSNPNKV